MYVTRDELAGALSAHAGAGARTAGQLPADRLDAAIAEAEDEVTGRLAARYMIPTSDPATPLAIVPLPGFVKGMILAIAGYVATLEWMNGKDLAPNDPVVLRYARAQGNLKLAAEGRLEVGLEDRDGGTTPETGDAATYDSVPAMGLAAEVLGHPGGGSPSFTGGYHGGGLTWG